MRCVWTRVAGGGVRVLCSNFRRTTVRCAFCYKPHDKRCDGDLGDGRTCDRPLCLGHVAVHLAPDTDYCLEHAPEESYGQQDLFARGG